jgi:uncharacterized damage-inducible protein DinB
LSVFSNQARSALGPQADAYVAGVLEALGQRDPLQVMRETPARLRAIVSKLPASAITAREAPGKWSIGEVIQHLADSELVGGNRFRMVMAHDRPPLLAYDQDLWAERLRYSESNVNDALEEFTTLRRSNVRLFEHATDEDFKRVGMHSERGAESLRHLLKLYAGHDLVHLRQIERIRTGGGAA